MELSIFGLLFFTLQFCYLAETAKNTRTFNGKNETAKNTWTFNGKNGPSHWEKTFPICSNKRQSPINIPLIKKEYQPKLKGSMELSHYTCPCRGSFEMKNTGRTLKLEVTEAMASLTFNKERRFLLDHLHFHWGSNNQIGSEHHFDGKSFPAEIHFVHHNIHYRHLLRAFDKEDGLAVLGVMVKLGKENPTFNKFLKHIHKVRELGQKHKIPPFDVKLLLPSNIRDFYTYKGSLTTPPCVDNVTWTIFYTPIEISKRQLKKFRSLKDWQGKALVNNFRPVQQLHGRTVKSSFRLFLE